jgi:hypothetical protein
MGRVREAHWKVRVVYALLAAANVGASALHFDPLYFTWWSFQVFLFLLLLGTVDLLTTNLVWFCFFNAVLVTIGVFTMSALRSEDGKDMLSQTAEESGLVSYAFQTYAVHYLPTVVAAIVAPFPGKDDLEELTGALLCAITVFVAYLSFHNPEEVYGVPVTPEIAFGSGAGFAAVVFAGFRSAGYH